MSVLPLRLCVKTIRPAGDHSGCELEGIPKLPSQAHRLEPCAAPAVARAVAESTATRTRICRWNRIEACTYCEASTMALTAHQPEVLAAGMRRETRSRVAAGGFPALTQTSDGLEQPVG